MGHRGNTREVVGELISFAELVRAGKNGLTESIVEHADDQSADECEVYGSAGLQSKCPAGGDRMFVDLAGERVVIGQRETRWQVAVESGETVLRALGPGKPAYLKLKPDGTMELHAQRIDLGGEAITTMMARADRTDAALLKLQTSYDVHTHLSAAPSSPTATPLPLVGALASTAADKVHGS